jgi:hypothetical protein
VPADGEVIVVLEQTLFDVMGKELLRQNQKWPSRIYLGQVPGRASGAAHLPAGFRAGTIESCAVRPGLGAVYARDLDRTAALVRTNHRSTTTTLPNRGWAS